MVCIGIKMNQQIRRSFLHAVNRNHIRCARRGFSLTSRALPMIRKTGCAKSPILTAMIKAKRELNLKVVTLDARNHGDSEHTPFMDYLTMRDDLLGVMDTLKVERPILLGHSMGGKTVMTCALTVPERVAALIVVDTAPKTSPGNNSLQVYAQKMKEISMPSASVSLPEARRQVGDQLKTFVEESEGVRQFLLTNLKQASDNSFFWRVNLDALIENFDSLQSFPQFSEPCTSVKTVFIGGARSKHVDSSAEPAIHRLFPGSPIERIPQAGHWVHSEKPTEFVELVRQFVLSSS